tara:strand:- start:909 stop:1466 length:558 start_codon:yes stop_codon:yes gene_type:complete
MIAIKKKTVKKEIIRNIKDITSSSLFHWNLYEEVVDTNQKLAVELNKKYKTKSTFQLVHTIYKQNQQYKSPHYPAFLALFQEIINKTVKRDVILLRMKVNLLFKSNKKAINIFHTDDTLDPNFFSTIYYVDDSDGDTVVYDNKKLIKIKPEAGKVLLFNGGLHHASSSPVKNKIRKVVNINFKYA